MRVWIPILWRASPETPFVICWNLLSLVSLPFLLFRGLRFLWKWDPLLSQFYVDVWTLQIGIWRLPSLVGPFCSNICWKVKETCITSFGEETTKCSEGWIRSLVILGPLLCFMFPLGFALFYLIEPLFFSGVPFSELDCFVCPSIFPFFPSMEVVAFIK